MRKLSILFFCISIFLTSAIADEGMWMMPSIQKLNIEKMRSLGCQLSADKIYNTNAPSLKDAVIIFNNNCTGVVISNQGLIFTNHHCGFEDIQTLSTPERNYLKNGFTAYFQEDEIPVPGLTVKFLIDIINITETVNSQLNPSLSPPIRSHKSDSIINELKAKELSEQPNTIVESKTMSRGNEQYLFIYKEFKDIRFCFAPPSSVGKFGGETDNWMWPRHTADFAVFRIYANAQGEPAEYSPTNIPFTPKQFATISNEGYQEGDFAFILGNPGYTSRKISSWGIQNRARCINQARIDGRGAKQEVWKSFMDKDENIQLAYASKYANSANYWKNSIGMNQAVSKLKIIEQKKEQEEQFRKWIEQKPERKEKYGEVLFNLERGYNNIYPFSLAANYMKETLIRGIDLPQIAYKAELITRKDISTDSILKEVKKLYQDYNATVDEATMIRMLEVFKKGVSPDALPKFYDKISKQHKGRFDVFARTLYLKSAYSTFEKFSKNFLNKTIKDNDPALVLYHNIDDVYNNFQPESYNRDVDFIDDNERLYTAGLIEMYRETGKPIYPDASFSMRMTYGTIKGYEPADGVKYNYYTTTKGLFEKEDERNEEFHIPYKLKQTILEKNFGRYVDAKSQQMQVNFISNTDITGGNSGSPIFNAKGELIGLAFDGNWEAMSGDLAFEPNLQRTINVDVRYILFYMEKVGGAQRLINEMKIQ